VRQGGIRRSEGQMRSSKISKFGCAALLVLIALFPSRRASAGGEELPAGDDGKSVIEDSGNSSDSSDSVGLGKFFKLPFHVSVSVRGGYDDNVLTATFDRQGSAFVNANIGLTYNFGSPRTTISLASSFGVTDYIDGPAGVDFDFNPNLTLSVTHKATPRLTLALTSYITYQQQPDFAVSAGLNRRSGSFFYTSDKFSAAYRWLPRFSTVTSYTFVALSYDESSVGSFEDRTEHTFGNEFRFLLWPTTSLVGEYRFGIVAYDSASIISRDSTTHYFLAGFDHSFSPRFTISTRAGVELRSYDNLGDRTDPYAEATLNYALGPHLSLTWTNRYSIEEPDVPGSPSRTTFRTGLSARYAITPRIVSALSIFWEHDDNEGSATPFGVSPSFAEDIFSVAFSLRYAINRNWGVELGYDFSDVESDIPFREYYRNRFYGGVNFQF
jgi:hypothetical protein